VDRGGAGADPVGVRSGRRRARSRDRARPGVASRVRRTGTILGAPSPSSRPFGSGTLPDLSTTDRGEGWL